MIDAPITPSSAAKQGQRLQSANALKATVPSLMATISNFFAGLLGGASGRSHRRSSTQMPVAARRKPPQSGSTIKVTRTLLSQTLCAGLPIEPGTEAEYQRRASEVAFLLRAAGAEVDMSEFEDGGGI